MNTQILQKCLDELKKEQPNIEYIKGMLETLILLSNPIIPIINNTKEQHVTEQVKELVEDVPAYLRAGPIGGIN